MKKILPVLSLFMFAATGIAQECFFLGTETRYWDSSSTSPGYTLFSAMDTAYLIDFEGHRIHAWANMAMPRFTDGGNILGASGSDSAGQGSWVELEWNGNVRWQYAETRSGYHPHDDFIKIFNPKLGDSTFLYIANKDLTAQQCLDAGCDPSYDYSGAQMDAVTEVDKEGNILWEWCFFDHTVQDKYPSKPNYGNVAATPGRIDINMKGNPVTADWLHCNSLDYNSTLDMIVINSVHSEFYVIDHGSTFLPGNPDSSIILAAGSAGNFKYRFGDPARYKKGNPPSVLDNWEKATNGQKQLGGSHHVQWIKPGLTGAGHFLLFSNGQYLFELTPQSYILEINPFLNASGVNTGTFVNPPDAGYRVVNSPDANLMKEKKNISKQVVWTFSAKNNTSFFSTMGSGVQRLENGNILVCSMNDGHLFEVSPSDSSVAWEYVNPVTSQGMKRIKRDHYPGLNPVNRALRYTAVHPALAGHSLAPGPTLTGMEPDYLTPVDLLVAVNTQVSNLVISTGQSRCYDALQTLTVAGSGTTVTVQSGGSVTLIAGELILLEPGLSVAEGGYLSGYIASNAVYCLAQSTAMVATNISGEGGVQNIREAGSLTLFPNPTHGRFTLASLRGTESGTMQMELFNTQGRLLRSETREASLHQSFDISEFPCGLYLMRVRKETTTQTLKIVKAK